MSSPRKLVFTFSGEEYYKQFLISITDHIKKVRFKIIGLTPTSYEKEIQYSTKYQNDPLIIEIVNNSLTELPCTLSINGEKLPIYFPSKSIWRTRNGFAESFDSVDQKNFPSPSLKLAPQHSFFPPRSLLDMLNKEELASIAAKKCIAM